MIRFKFEACLLAMVLLASLSHGLAAQGAGPVQLLSHAASYTLSLDAQKPSGNIAAADGRLDYSLEQTSCSWFRALTSITLSLRGKDGRRVTTQSVTEVVERVGGSEMQFKTRRTVDGKQVQASEGNAARVQGRVLVRTTLPYARTQELTDDHQFPVQLLSSVIDNAANARLQSALRLYDGAEDGLRPYRVSAQIGAEVSRPSPPDNAPRRAWPIVLGYQPDASAGTTPETELAAVLSQNGVYSDLRLSFREFALRGTLAQLTPIPPGQCD